MKTNATHNMGAGTLASLTGSILLLASLTGCRAREVARPAQAPSTPTPVSPAGETPVAIGPAGLLRPGGVEVIQRQLEKSGHLTCPCNRVLVDDRMRAALARYQKEKGLPPTGLPTYETVERMGLEPDQVFRHAAPGPDAGT